MKISFSTLGCPEWSWNEMTSAAKDLGYDGIEVRGVQNELHAPRIREFTPEHAGGTIQQLGVLSLSIPCLTSACNIRKKEREAEILEEAYAYIDVAHRMGIPYVRVLGDADPCPKDEVDAAYVQEMLVEIARYGRPKGVMPLIESNGYFADTKRIKTVLEGVTNAGALWDIHHPYRFFNEPPEETLQNIGEHIHHVHVKDSLLSGGRIRYTMVSYGDIPVKKCVQLLNGAGYKGYYSLEWLKRWDLSLEEPAIAFAQYAGYMRALK